MLDSQTQQEAQNRLSAYLTEKKLRKTEERITILDQICAIDGHFDVNSLLLKMEASKYHVSRATIYNTLEVFVDAGVVVQHQLHSQSVQYELRKRAETHIHFTCSQCHCLREIKNPPALGEIVAGLKNSFKAEYFSLYIHGLCGRCKNKAQREAHKHLKMQKNRIK
jgi:Fur family ferric uptake transcriptional regulator